MYARDRTSPELYVAIKDLAEAILVVKRLVQNAKQVEYISHELATDFYLDISSGALEVQCWTKYISLRLRTYRGRYYDATSKIDVVVDDPLEASNLAENLYSSSQFQFSKVSTAELEDLIDYYPEFLFKQFDKIVRYNRGTLEYSRTLISVLLNITRQSTRTRTHAFRSYDDSSYVELLSDILMRRLESYSNILCDDKRSNEHTVEELIHSYKSFKDE